MSKNTITPQLKYGSTSDWAKAVNFIPDLGTIIVYNDVNPPKIKYGDGKTKVNDLAYVGESNYQIDNDTLII